MTSKHLETSKKTRQKDVAAALNCSGESLRIWAKLKGAPASWDIVEWQRFVDANNLNKGNSVSLAALKVEIAQEELKKKRRENAVAEGKMIAEDVVRDFLRDWMAKLDMALTAELEVNTPPLVAGRSVADVRERLREVHDRIRDATKSGLLKWTPGQ